MAIPSGKKQTPLTSDSCPVKVWVHFPLRMSHILTVQSADPVANDWLVGCRETVRQSAACSVKDCLVCTLEMSHSTALESPEEVMILLSSMNLAEER